MTEREQKIDDIDLQLFKLASRAEDIGESQLAIAIRKARAISFMLLPESRRKDVQ